MPHESFDHFIVDHGYLIHASQNQISYFADNKSRVGYNTIKYYIT